MHHPFSMLFFRDKDSWHGGHHGFAQEALRLPVVVILAEGVSDLLRVVVLFVFGSFINRSVTLLPTELHI